MKFMILVGAIILIAIMQVNGQFPNYYGDIQANNVVGNPGEPLFLTPLIEQNRIEEAQAAAFVDPTLFLNVTSYSGYLTVNAEFDSNLFFWFFPSHTDYPNAPVVLWLQGGPGAPSVYGLFQENGPFELVSGAEPKLRTYAWTQQHSVVYIDNPVGTGFSFTNNGYARNQTRVGAELYIALQQFFKLFPALQKNEFYITGESYAGKYAPAIGYTILQSNPSAELKINLQGIAIGNGWTDPEHQYPKYGAYLFQLGLIDFNTRNIFTEYEEQAVEYIQEGRYEEANQIIYTLTNSGISIFSNETGYKNMYNYLYPLDLNPLHDEYLGEFLSRDDVRAAIHVGNTTFGDGNVYGLLAIDIPQSVARWVEELLSNYRVLIYTGQLDIIVAYPLTLNYLQNLNFSSAEEYKTAERNIWYVDDELAGYVKQAGNLTEVLVRNAGHMVPTDQPKWALDMLTKFIRNIPINEPL